MTIYHTLGYTFGSFTIFVPKFASRTCKNWSFLARKWMVLIKTEVFNCQTSKQSSANWASAAWLVSFGENVREIRTFRTLRLFQPKEKSSKSAYRLFQVGVELAFQSLSRIIW